MGTAVLMLACIVILVADIFIHQCLPKQKHFNLGRTVVLKKGTIMDIKTEELELLLAPEVEFSK